MISAFSSGVRKPDPKLQAKLVLCPRNFCGTFVLCPRNFLSPELLEAAVDGAGAYGEKFLFDFWSDGEVFFDPRQPHAQDFLEPYGPGIVSRLPDGCHNAQDLGVIGLGMKSRGGCFGTAWLRS